jgi:hypothetical protein
LCQARLEVVGVPRETPQGVGRGDEMGDRIVGPGGRMTQGVGASRKVAGGRSHMLYMGNVAPDDGLFESCGLVVLGNVPYYRALSISGNCRWPTRLR